MKQPMGPSAGAEIADGLVPEPASPQLREIEEHLRAAERATRVARAFHERAKHCEQIAQRNMARVDEEFEAICITVGNREQGRAPAVVPSSRIGLLKRWFG